MRGYKVFNSDWTCRGFQYEVGKTFEEDVTPVCCDRGFHFCTKAADCFNYYSFDSNNKVAEVEALGEIDSESDNSKHCTNKIKIVREISWHEVLDLVNLGKDCTGFCNSGNCNSGDWNSGNRNSGDWNKTCFSNGCFNTESPKIFLFNKPSDWTFQDWMNSDARWIMNNIPTDVLEWRYSEDMTDEEKAAHPEHETTGGYLRVYTPKETAQMWWDGLSENRKNIILNIPNFDADIFEEITGIKVVI